LANELKLRYWGRRITLHADRNWLLGKTIPTQDKLRVLANWLQGSPDAMRFDSARSITRVSESDISFEHLDMSDREVVTALSIAAIAKKPD
jgi:hypothetical protein